MTLDDILENYDDEDFLLITGFNTAVIGFEQSSMRLIYSSKEIMNVLLRDMTIDDAIEHFEYNIVGSCISDDTPIICHDI